METTTSVSTPYQFSDGGIVTQSISTPSLNHRLIELQHHQKNILCPFVTTASVRESADYQQQEGIQQLQKRLSSSHSPLYSTSPQQQIPPLPPQFPDSPQPPPVDSSSPQQQPQQQQQQQYFQHRQSIYGQQSIFHNNQNQHDQLGSSPSGFSSASPLFAHQLQQPQITNQLEYLQWLQQVQREQQMREQEQPIERPLTLWCIGIIDVLSAVWYMALVVHSMFMKPITDPDAYIWRFFVGFLGIIGRFLMGVGLITGLRSKDDSNTLWYCKLWVACQLVFFAQSVIEVISNVLLYAANSSRKQELQPAFLAVVAVFVYRVISFILVRLFVRKLKKSECMSVGDAIAYAEHQQQLQDQEDEENARGIGESSFCGPSVALIMSL